jgi:ribosomal protein L24E
MIRGLVAAFAAFLLVLGSAAADDDEPSAKAALQALNDFIGDWKGSGAPEKPRPLPRETWQESLNWSWRFKGDDAWLVLTVENGKYLQGGELRYLPDKKRYQLTATDAKGQKRVFEGELKKGYLTLDYTDPATKEVQRLMMNSAGDGLRFVYRSSHRPAGGTLFVKGYQVAFTKKGESLAGRAKKAECVVTGGLGTMAVSYNGQTYYVCCSGCRDAFNENPEKYIKEFEAKKKKEGR